MVGIIANPASGKDIRRIVGQALVVGNREKVNIVKRTLIGLYSEGVKEVCMMPDSFGIGQQSVNDLRISYPEVVQGVQILDMPVFNSPEDTTRATSTLLEMGAQVIITLGGDGTVRDVAKESGSVPLLPISTGTNNVLPVFIEGTVAGLAVGRFIASNPDQRKEIVERQKRIDVYVNGEFRDFALVDLVLTNDLDIGSKAIWDAKKILQISVTRTSMEDIGFSAILANIRTILPENSFGATTIIAQNGNKCAYQVTAPIGPGMIESFCLESYKVIHPGERQRVVDSQPAVIALDGERKMILRESDRVEFELSLDGPYFINAGKALATKQIMN